MAVLDQQSGKSSADSEVTASEVALRLLQRDIVSGALEPDSKLKLRILKERYGIGSSPMREALAQLAAQGLVRQSSQRGFRVPPISAAHLLDITRSRQLIEVEAVKLAIANGGADWEDEIVTSYHLLERLYHRLRGAERPDVQEFEARHQRFHRALIAACPLASVREFCDRLYVQATRYRLLLRRYAFTREVVIAEHGILMRAVLSRNEAKAAKALHAHIGITADVLLSELAGRTAGKSAGKKTSSARKAHSGSQARSGRKQR